MRVPFEAPALAFPQSFSRIHAQLSSHVPDCPPRPVGESSHDIQPVFFPRVDLEQLCYLLLRPPLAPAVLMHEVCLLCPPIPVLPLNHNPIKLGGHLIEHDSLDEQLEDAFLKLKRLVRP